MSTARTWRRTRRLSAGSSRSRWRSRPSRTPSRSSRACAAAMRRITACRSPMAPWSRPRIRRMTAPPDLREYDEKIAGVRREKESAIDSQDFEKAAALRDNEKQLIAKKDAREKEWKAGDMDVVAEVNEELIAEVLAAATGIPVFKLTEEESQRLLRMEDELHRRVIGQNDAIKALSQAIRRTRAGLKDPKRPGGSFIFAGPS